MCAIDRISAVVAALLLCWSADAFPERVFDIDTYLAMQSISAIAISPDDKFLAYTVSKNDLEADSSTSAVWMQPVAGGEAVRMTSGSSSAWSPQWSPDNRYLAVLSSRNGSGTQVWLLDRRGGDAVQLTQIKQGVRSYEWSPDGKKMLLLVKDPSLADLDDEPRPNPRPYVIDSLQFKRDYVGYLDNRRTHVYVVDIAVRSVRQVTFGNFDDSQPTWSPDGQHIVFVSNRTESPDTNRNTDLWRVDISKDSPEAEQLTTASYADSLPVYSPNGDYIAYQSSISDGLPVYAIPQLTILDLDTGISQRVESLREIQAWNLRFTDGNRSVVAIIEYRGEQQLVRVDLASGEIERLITGEDVVRHFDISNSGDIFALISRPQRPSEIYHFVDGQLRRVSTINGDLMADVKLGAVEKHQYTAADGTVLDTFVMFPPDYKKGDSYPALLHTHGGPWTQWDWSFNYESQLFAAQGFVVVMPNFRGSWGYGQAFTDALAGKWGEIDYSDSMDAMDFAIDKGWIDADRLATYGWSWGGYLTNHIITRTDRFKAAISGAGETLMTATYGHDEWLRLWDEELGFPWLKENRQNWERVSPFYRLGNVTTPTLVVCGEEDWNMPVIHSEQLYMVLKRRGVPTQLVVYPGEHHSLSAPSYERDLYQRYFDWLDTYVPE